MKIMKTVSNVAKSIGESAGKLSKLEAYVVAYYVVRLSKKVADGLITEAEAFKIIKAPAQAVVILQGISISTSLILFAMDKYTEYKKNHADEKDEEEEEWLDSDEDDDIEDLDVDPDPAEA